MKQIKLRLSLNCDFVRIQRARCSLIEALESWTEIVEDCMGHYLKLEGIGLQILVDWRSNSVGKSCDHVRSESKNSHRIRRLLDDLTEIAGMTHLDVAKWVHERDKSNVRSAVPILRVFQ